MDPPGKHGLNACYKVLITGTSPISSRLYGVSAPFTGTGERRVGVHFPALSSCSGSKGPTILSSGLGEVLGGPETPQ